MGNLGAEHVVSHGLRADELKAEVFDPDIDYWLRARALDPTAVDTSVVGMRIHLRAVNRRATALLGHVATPPTQTDLVLDTPTGPVDARIYRCANVPGPSPTILFFHGGGWVLGDLETHMQDARRLCIESQSMVISVDYRRAPEHRFPAAYLDCLAATQWTIAHAAELGVDPGRIVVAGGSAGGQLAASVAIACRNEGTSLAAQLLIVPATDLRGAYADSEVNSRYPSRQQRGTGYGLTTAAMQAFTQAYRVDDVWQASPMCASDLANLAPAVVHVAGFDPLHDEGVAYAKRLEASGVPVVLREWGTLNHGYFTLGGISATAERAARQASQDLRFLLGASVATPSGDSTAGNLEDQIVLSRGRHSETTNH